MATKKKQEVDITGKIGGLHDECEWQMYSYERAAYTMWNHAAQALVDAGWTLEEVRVLLQSKYPRWSMDHGALCNALEKAGKAFAKECLSEHATIKEWAKEIG